MGLTIRSDAFAEDRAIPRRYGEDGEELSPPLILTDLPQGTRGRALIVEDPDVPRPEPWVHWVLYKIPADVNMLTEGVPRLPTLDIPLGAMQGRMSWGTDGYRGPAPPPGLGEHHSHFWLYALGVPLHAAQGLDKRCLLDPTQGPILCQAELIGIYQT
jgi:Raf kinase inhibitor-like YbhB/YbcL family protein